MHIERQDSLRQNETLYFVPYNLFPELVGVPKTLSLEPFERSRSVLSLLFDLPFSAQELSFASMGLDIRHDFFAAGSSLMYSSLTSYVLL